MNCLKTLTLSAVLIIIVASVSCTEDAEVLEVVTGTDSTTINNTTTLTNLNEFFNNNGPVEQTFRFDPSVESTITSASGNIRLMIEASSFACGVAPCADSLTVLLTEYLTLNSMFLGNVQTESNGQLLVTGGAFNWNVVDGNGDNAELTGSVTAEIEPQTNVTGFENDLAYYLGEQVDGDGQQVVNWNLQQGEFGFADNIFTIFGLDLGLVNCDALYDIAANNPTQFTVGLTAAENITLSEQSVWLFVDDFPSVINIYTNNNGVFATYDNSIPTGLTGTLVGIGLDEESQLLFGSQSITVAGDDVFDVSLTYGTEADLVTLINSIGN